MHEDVVLRRSLLAPDLPQVLGVVLAGSLRRQRAHPQRAKPSPSSLPADNSATSVEKPCRKRRCGVVSVSVGECGGQEVRERCPTFILEEEDATHLHAPTIRPSFEEPCAREQEMDSPPRE